MRAFAPISIFLITLSPLAATSQEAAPMANPRVPIVAHGTPVEAGAERAHGRRDQHPGHGDRAMRRFEELVASFDMDGDGTVTQEEVDATRTERLAKFDADGDGELTLEEYQALWLDAMHERMVDRFQAHDDDGTGTITVEEFLEDYARLVDRADRNEDGKLSEEDFARRGPRHPAPAPEEAPSEE